MSEQNNQNINEIESIDVDNIECNNAFTSESKISGIDKGAYESKERGEIMKKNRQNYTHKSYVELRRDLVKFIRMENEKYNEEEKDKIIEIIKNTVSTADDKNLYKKLIDELKFMEDPPKFVRKFLLYYRRSCRNGRDCNLKDCFFNHQPDIKGLKRREVVINKVPTNLQETDKILDYCSQYGTVKIIKALNDTKYLLRFEKEEDASNFIDDKAPVLGDEGITKFYNIFMSDKEKLLELIKEEQKIINELFSKGEKDLALSLKTIHNKMKKIISQFSDD